LTRSATSVISSASWGVTGKVGSVVILCPER
jgi:hypothetical protein